MASPNAKPTNVFFIACPQRLSVRLYEGVTQGTRPTGLQNNIRIIQRDRKKFHMRGYAGRNPTSYCNSGPEAPEASVFHRFSGPKKLVNRALHEGKVASKREVFCGKILQRTQDTTTHAI